MSAFLYVMSQPNLFESTTEAKDWSQRLKDVILQLKKVNTGNATAKYTGINVERVEQIMAALVGMTADHWPDPV